MWGCSFNITKLTSGTDGDGTGDDGTEGDVIEIATVTCHPNSMVLNMNLKDGKEYAIFHLVDEGAFDNNPQ